MRSLKVLAILVVASAPFAASSLADDKAADKKKAEIAAKEKATFDAIAAKLASFARTCAQANAIGDARAELELGLTLAPDSDALKKAKDALKDTSKPATEDYRKTGAQKRADAHKFCAEKLGELVKFCAKKGSLDHFEERVVFLTSQLGGDGALAGAAYFDPYRKWVTDEDKAKLDAGCELIDDKWLKPPEVEALNKKHGTFDDPWILSDEVHDVKTNLPYREAEQVFLQVHAYRTFFLKKFESEWDLQQPKGIRLEVVVTMKQTEFKAEIEKRGLNPAGERLNMEAVYYHGNPGPVFATKEPRMESGAVFDAKLGAVLNVLQHELTHQICWEFSKHAESDRGEQCMKWAKEGFPTYMQMWRLDRKGWHFTCPNPKNRRADDGEDYSFSWCKENPTEPQSLDGFFGLSDQYFRVDHYYLGCAVSYFLLDAEGGKYHKDYLKLLALVHRNKATKTLARECFASFDLKKMEDEYRRFIQTLKLDEASAN